MSLKNTVIFGDSYSTFEGYIPDGYSIYYTPKELKTDITKVEETWWHSLLSEVGGKLILNNSWSGSTIGFTGYNQSDCSKSSSFIYRFEKLLSEGFFEENKIDTVFIFGGTNDSWSGAPLGELKFENFSRSDLYNVLPAISYFTKMVCEALPEAKVYALANTGNKWEITDAIVKSAEKWGAVPIVFESIDKISGHPTILGMQNIKNKILEFI